MTIAASATLFFFGGGALDRWAGTEPLFSVLGALLGAGAGIYYMIRRLMPGEGPGDGAG
jgi:F0F1-type ATP synthase assembly protein I